MPTYILRPTGESKADWTEVPAGTAWSHLDEAVLQPTVPDTSTNYITSNAWASNITSQETFDNIALETPTSLTGWAYVLPTGNATGFIELFFWDTVGNAQWGPKTTLAGGSAAQWISVDGGVAGLTQAKLDGMELRVGSTQTSGGTWNYCYAMYVEYVTPTITGPATAGMFTPQLIEQAWF